MLFDYRARDKTGKIMRGAVEAEGEAVALDILKDQGFSVISLEIKKGGWLKTLKEIRLFAHVSIRDLVIFSRQLSVMISADVPVVQALRILIKQTVNPTLKEIVTDLADEVEGGAKLSSALSRHPKVFSDFFINIIRSGETTGKLDEVLEYLAAEQEKDYDLMSKIKGAMIYPIFILSALAAVGVVMMIFVIPKLTAVLEESGATLPLSTRILIATSDFMKSYWWLLLMIILGLIAGMKYLVTLPEGRKYWGFLKIKLPIFGQIFQRIYIVRFTRSFLTLTNGGVEIVQSLKIVADVVGNAVYRDLILKTIKEVEDGNPIITIFAKSKEMPPMVTQMLGIGEETGKIDVILGRLTDFYSRELDNLVRNLVTIMEPLIMILMGVAVGIMVSAIILPMYNLAAQF
jgi:type IV pilus assembly protein PilC